MVHTHSRWIANTCLIMFNHRPRYRLRRGAYSRPTHASDYLQALTFLPSTFPFLLRGCSTYRRTPRKEKKGLAKKRGDIHSHPGDDKVKKNRKIHVKMQSKIQKERAEGKGRETHKLGRCRDDDVDVDIDCCFFPFLSLSFALSFFPAATGHHRFPSAED